LADRTTAAFPFRGFRSEPGQSSSSRISTASWLVGLQGSEFPTLWPKPQCASLTLDRAAGSRPFLRSLLGLHARALAFEVALSKVHQQSGGIVCTAFVTFASFRDMFRFTQSVRVPSTLIRQPKLLPSCVWFVPDSSLGVSKMPLRRQKIARPLPVDSIRRRCLPSVQGCHTSNTFRPRRSSRPRRFAPHRSLQVCCTLQPIMGFARFSTRRFRDPKVPSTSSLSPRAHHPPKSSPRL